MCVWRTCSIMLACVRGEGGVPRDKRGTFSVHWQTQRGAALAARVQSWQVGSAQTLATTTAFNRSCTSLSDTHHFSSLGFSSRHE